MKTKLRNIGVLTAALAGCTLAIVSAQSPVTPGANLYTDMSVHGVGGGGGGSSVFTLTSHAVPVLGTTYQNTTGTPIVVSAGGYCSGLVNVVYVNMGPASPPAFTVAGVNMLQYNSANTYVSTIVPSGYYYSFSMGEGSCTINDGSITQ